MCASTPISTSIASVQHRQATSTGTTANSNPRRRNLASTLISESSWCGCLEGSGFLIGGWGIGVYAHVLHLTANARAISYK